MRQPNLPIPVGEMSPVSLSSSLWAPSVDNFSPRPGSAAREHYAKSTVGPIPVPGADRYEAGSSQVANDMHACICRRRCSDLLLPRRLGHSFKADRLRRRRARLLESIAAVVPVYVSVEFY